MSGALPGWEGTRALVLGVSGFIGRWVAAALEQGGARVEATARGPATAALGMAGVALTPIELDATDFDELERLVRDLRPEATFNLVGYGVDRTERDPHLAERLNAALPGRLAGLLSGTRRGDGRPALVHAGSALEYGDASRVGEDDPTAPTTLYGRTKLAGTRAVEARAGDRLGAVTARMFTVYGPGEHPGRLLPTLLEAAVSGAPVDLSEGRQTRDFAHVDDVAEGLLRLGAAIDPPAIVNLATGRITAVRSFAEIAARELRIPAERLRFGALPGLEEEMSHEPVPIARLRSAVDWAPAIEIDEGVRRTARVLEIHTQDPHPRDGSD